MGNTRDESEIIRCQLLKLGKCVYQIPPDGDCLFSAVADQLCRIDSRVSCAVVDNRLHAAGDVETAVTLASGDCTECDSQRGCPTTWRNVGPQALRAVAAAAMRDNVEKYSAFITEDFDKYVARIEHPAVHEWGGQVELRCVNVVSHRVMQQLDIVERKGDANH